LVDSSYDYSIQKLGQGEVIFWENFERARYQAVRFQVLVQQR
jgi:hypothetical protein